MSDLQCQLLLLTLFVVLMYQFLIGNVRHELNQEFEERKDRYDQEQEALVNQRLSSIRSSLEDKTKQILTIQDQARCQEIEALQKEYDTNHTLYATQILKKITEV